MLENVEAHCIARFLLRLSFPQCSLWYHFHLYLPLCKSALRLCLQALRHEKHRLLVVAHFPWTIRCHTKISDLSSYSFLEVIMGLMVYKWCFFDPPLVVEPLDKFELGIIMSPPSIVSGKHA